MMQNYLNQIQGVVERAVDHYKRVFAIRFYLKYPYTRVNPDDELINSHMEKFIDLLKKKILYHMDKSGVQLEQGDDIEIGFVWVEDCCKEGRPLYHLLLLFNEDAFRTLGYFDGGRAYMRSRLASVWASILQLPAERCSSFVYFARIATYCLDAYKLNPGLTDISECCRYLSWVASKEQSKGLYSFGCSHRYAQ